MRELFSTAYHVVLMQRLKLAEIATLDADSDRDPGLQRVRL